MDKVFLLFRQVELLITVLEGFFFTPLSEVIPSVPLFSSIPVMGVAINLIAKFTPLLDFCLAELLLGVGLLAFLLWRLVSFVTDLFS